MATRGLPGAQRAGSSATRDVLLKRAIQSYQNQLVDPPGSTEQRPPARKPFPVPQPAEVLLILVIPIRDKLCQSGSCP
jgi:hypothetical protein